MTSREEKEILRKIKKSDEFTPNFRLLSNQIDYDQYIQPKEKMPFYHNVMNLTKAFIPLMICVITLLIPIISHNQVRKMMIFEDTRCVYALGGEQICINEVLCINKKLKLTFSFTDDTKFQVKSVEVSCNDESKKPITENMYKVYMLELNNFFNLKPNDIVTVKYEVFDRVNRITSYFEFRVLCYFDENNFVKYKFIY